MEEYFDLSMEELEMVEVEADNVLEVVAYYREGFAVVDREQPNFVVAVDIEKMVLKACSYLVPLKAAEFVVVDRAGFVVVLQKLVVYFAMVQIIDLPSN